MLLSRRSALAVAGVTLLGTTACDVDDLRPPEDDAAPAPTPTAPGEPTLDEQIVSEVLTALAGAVSALQATRRTPALRPTVASLLRAHRRHEAVLGGPVDAAPTTAPLDLRGVRALEQSLRTLLVDAATRAESGSLACVLASEAASVGQHLAVLR